MTPKTKPGVAPKPSLAIRKTLPTVVKCSALGGGVAEYEVPTVEASLRHSRETWGRSFDKIERTFVEGGQALLWKRISP